LILPHPTQLGLVALSGQSLELIFVDNVDEVLKIALTKPLIPIEWDEEESIKSSSELSDDETDQDLNNPITH
jgi:hypothetical protein